jgi:SAM-dependent methyltransferase
MEPEEAAELLAENRQLWDARTKVHLRIYRDVEVVRNGGISLGSPDLEEVGPVEGRSLLHLQCHFGLDTLSWARLGANAVGLDFSPEAIRAARALAEECGLAVQFVEADVYDATKVLNRQFDIVTTSHGVLWWLPNLARWGEVVAACVRPGGSFYICEIHPLALGMRLMGGSMVLTQDYFSDGQPQSFRTSDTYVDFETEVEEHAEHGWTYTMADFINALTSGGLAIDYLHEFPFAGYPMLRDFTQDAEGHWWPPEGCPQVPLLFSLRAHRPSSEG